MDKPIVPFCKPDYAANEIAHLNASIAGGRLEGGGEFTRSSEASLKGLVGCEAALVVPSCTAALEMMALVLDLQPGDEVVMPAFTFVSTANAVAMRGAVPVFAEIDPDTLNLDVEAAAAAITPRTKAIMVVHYAGVGCDMTAFQALCSKHDLVLLEDAAQGLGAAWDGNPLGSFGQYAAFSFHHTKNLSCGEGGAFITNAGGDSRLAEFVRDKGTNRADFLRGTERKYEWLVLGSSFLLSELAAAVLLGQLERMEELLDKRMTLWNRYHDALRALPGVITPRIPVEAQHNAHIYHLRLSDRESRDRFCKTMREQGIVASPHYVPLHTTPGGMRFGRSDGNLDHTCRTADTLVRLPLFSAMTHEEQDLVIGAALDFFAS